MDQIITEGGRNAARTIGQVLRLAKIDAAAFAKLGELISKLDQHVHDYGGSAKGALTIKLDFRVDRDGVETRAKVTANTPEAPATRSNSFIGADGDLTGSNPLQPDLPLRDVMARESAVVDV